MYPAVSIGAGRVALTTAVFREVIPIMVFTYKHLGYFVLTSHDWAEISVPPFFLAILVGCPAVSNARGVYFSCRIHYAMNFLAHSSLRGANSLLPLMALCQDVLVFLKVLAAGVSFCGSIVLSLALHVLGYLRYGRRSVCPHRASVCAAGFLCRRRQLADGKDGARLTDEFEAVVTIRGLPYGEALPQGR